MEFVSSTFSRRSIGTVTQILSARKGKSALWNANEAAAYDSSMMCRRAGLSAFAGAFLPTPRGLGVMHTIFTVTVPGALDSLPRQKRRDDPIVTASASGYAIFICRKRGRCFIGAVEPVYEG